MRVAASIAIAFFVSSVAWGTPRLPNRWLIATTAASLSVIVAGGVLGWPLYPWSDVVTLAFGIFGGVLLGRTYPSSLSAFLILLAVLSALDVAQNLAFSGPPSPSPAPASATPDPHFIWLNFRIPLPDGHFNIGFADLVVIAAITEHLRRNKAPFLLSLSPGIAGLLLAELVFAVHQPTGAIDSALIQSLIPYLTLGWLAAETVLRALRPR